MPPAIIGAVVALGASGLAAASIISVTTALVIGMAATVAGSLLSKPKLPGMGNIKSQQERKQVVRSSAASCNVIYGTTMISGVLIFAEEEPGDQDDGEWIHMVLAIAGHKINRIVEFYIGDDKASTYGNNVVWALLNDLQEADPYLLKKCPSWKQDMIGKGVALVRVSLKYDQEMFPSGLPNLKFVVEGKLVWDPRTNTEYFTDNAALCTLDYYLTTIGVKKEDMMLAEYVSAANTCDEMVQNADGSMTARYTVNGTFDVSEPFNDVLMDGLFQACGGEPTYIAGKHGILVGAYYGPPAPNMVLTQDHLRDDVSITPEASFKDLTNIIRGVYVDPKQDYNETDFPPVVIEEWLQQDGRELAEDFKFRFVNNPYTAQRLATIAVHRKRVSRMMELPINLKGFKFRPGRFINIDLPHLGINMVEFRVTKWDFDPQAGISITVRQESPSTYNDVVGKIVELPPLTNLRPETIAAPQNIRFNLDKIGDVVQGVLQWENPQEAAYNNVVIFDSTGNVVNTIQVPGNRVQLNGLVKGKYKVNVYAFGFNGAKSSPGYVEIDISAPNMPTNIRVESGFYSVSIYPSSSDLNAPTFEYWMSDKALTGDAVILQNASRLGQGSFWTVENLNPMQIYYFHVRTINIYGASTFKSVAGRASTKADEILDVVGKQWQDSELGQVIKDMEVNIENLDVVNKALEDVIRQNKDDVEKLNIAVRKSFQTIGDVTFQIRQNKGTNEAEIKRVEGVVATETEARVQSFEYLNAKVEGVNGTLTGELNTFKEVYATDKAVLVTWQQEAIARFEYNESSILEIQETTSTLTESVAQHTRQLTAQQSTLESQGVTLDSQGKLLNAQGLKLDEQGRLVDSQGKIINSQGIQLDSQGKLINDQGKVIDSHGVAITEHASRITSVEKVSATNTQSITENKQAADSRFASNEASINQAQQTAASAEDAAVKFAVQMAAESKKTQENINESKAEILDVKNIVANQELAMAQQISQLKTEFNGNIATINGQLKVVSDATSANASAIQILATDVGNNKGQISSIQTSITTLEKSVQETKDQLYAQTQSTDQRFTAVNQTINQTKTELEKSIASSNQTLSSQIATVDGKAVQAGKDAATANSNAGKAQTTADGATKNINDYKTANDKEIVLVKADIKSNREAIATEKQARTTDVTNLQASLNSTNAKVEQKMEAVVEHNGTVAATYTLRAGIELPNGTYKSAGLFLGVSGGTNPVASVGVNADNFVVMNSRNGKLETVFQVDSSGNVVIRNALISKLFVEEAIVGSTLSSADFSATKGIQIDFKNGKIIANGGTWGAGLNVGNPTGKGLSITDQTILVRDENGRLRFACGYIKGLV
ncbi:central tail fiber J [Providencia phage PSTCR4]|uniref:Fibronectin type-III domain-containing protein n=1 Tax=Providencia phage PSTCR4 TaxID=2783546 RepID=A0A873WX10_9CAUD|nr:central tail fiber J [Providencia phage PSTCR4]QPB12057.1 hypothetical protein [Providencia phage PSTCR4]